MGFSTSLFNFPISGGTGDHTVLSPTDPSPPGTLGNTNRLSVWELNIQNRSTTTNTNIEVKTSNGNVVGVGPVTLIPFAMLSMELEAHIIEPLIALGPGESLIVNSDADVPLSVWGWMQVR